MQEADRPWDWTPPSRLRGWLRPGLSLALALALVAWLLSRTSVWEVFGMLGQISGPWGAVGLAGFLVANVFRAARFRVLIRGAVQTNPPPTRAAESLPAQAPVARPTGFPTLLPITVVHNMFNSLLGRAGEVSFLYMAKTQLGLPLGESTAIIVVARVLDYLAISAILLAAALAIPGGSLSASPLIFLVVSTALLAAAGALVLAPWLGGRTVAAASRWLGQNRRAYSVLEAARTIVGSLSVMRKADVLAPTLVWSLLLWTANFGAIYAFLIAVGVEIWPVPFVVGATFGVLSKALPFVTPGGFGLHEAGWTLGFVLVGLDETTAIASGFAVNILTLLASLAYGLPGLLWMYNPVRRG